MFENVKIVFIDIDNTLTTQKDKYNVSVENKLAIKELQKRKIYVVLSTGRSKKDVGKIWNQIHLNEYSRYFIYSNGACIYDAIDNKVIYSNPISDDNYKELIDYSLEKNLYFILSENSNIWVNHSPKYFERMLANFLHFNLKKYDPNFEIEYQKNKFGIFVSLNQKKSLKEVEILKNDFQNLEVTTATRNKYIEVTNKNVSKSEAAQFILKLLDIDKKYTLALGDSMNDYELFKLVQTSVVVKNGTKQLKKIASYQTKSNKKNGVAKTLNAIK